jgi:hypothetical protein
VAWWRTLGRLGLGPQSISLVLHIFHVISTHGFVFVSQVLPGKLIKSTFQRI